MQASVPPLFSPKTVSAIKPKGFILLFAVSHDEAVVQRNKGKFRYKKTDDKMKSSVIKFIFVFHVVSRGGKGNR